MATQPAPSSDPAVAHQFAQAQLAAAPVAEMVANAFLLLNPTDLAGSLDKIKALILATVTTQGRASAALALANYRARRRAAGITTPLRLTPADTAAVSQVEKSINWAAKDLWGPVNTEPITNPDGTVLAPFEARVEQAISNATGAAQKIVLDAGRDTTLRAVQHDPKARGWYRQTEPDACYFCAMLATRGAVYRSETTASFETHDHCECQAEPDFGDYAPSEQVQAWQDLYHSIPHAGSTKGQQAAWRKAFAKKYANTQNPAQVAG